MDDLCLCEHWLFFDLCVCEGMSCCVDGPVALALSLSQATPCTTLPFTHTERHFHPEHNADWPGDEGGRGQMGHKGVGWSNRVEEKLEKVCVLFVSSEEVHWVVSSFFGRPGYMCRVEGYSKHTVTPLSLPLSPVCEQQPVLCAADCSVWVLRLWMLAMAMCHVLRILSLFVSSVNTLSVYVGFKQTAACLLSDRCSDLALKPMIVLYENMHTFCFVTVHTISIGALVWSLGWGCVCLCWYMVAGWNAGLRPGRVLVTRSHINSVELASDNGEKGRVGGRE